MTGLKDRMRLISQHRLKAAGAAALLLILILVLARAALAEAAVSSWCKGRGLDCGLNITGLGLGGVTAEYISVDAGDEPLLRARRAEIDLAWRGLFSAAPKAVRLTAPSLRARYDGETFEIAGLEAFSGGGGSGGALPQIEIKDGEIVVETPAGDAVWLVSAVIENEANFNLSARATPALLRGAGGILSLEAADIVAVSEAGSLSAEALVEVGPSRLGAASANTVFLQMRAVPSPDGVTTIDLEGRAEGLRQSGLSAEALDFSTLIRADSHLPKGGRWDEVLRDFAFDFEGSNLEYGRGVVSTLRASGAGARGDTGAIEGGIEVEGADIADASAVLETLSFEGRFGTSGGLSLYGDLRAAGAALSETALNAFSVIRAPTPVDAHADALRTALQKALAGFDAALPVRLSQSENSGWRLESAGAPAFTSQSGLTLSLTPPEDAVRMSLEGGVLRAAGDLALRGPGRGGVSLALSGLDLEAVSGAARVDLKALTLEPWRVEGLTLGGRLTDLTARRALGTVLANAATRLRFDGDLSGLDVEALEVRGGMRLSAVNGPAVLRTNEGKCLQYSASGIEIAGIEIGAHKTQLCPEGGVLLDMAEAPGGRLSLGDLKLPFVRGPVAGDLIFDDARAAWSAKSGFRVGLTASAFEADTELNAKSLDYESGKFSAEARFGVGPARYVTTSEDGALSGDAMPANVTLETLSFDGAAAAEALNGSLKAGGVLISDKREDPLYRPIAMTLDAPIEDGVLKIDTPLTLSRGGALLANLSGELQLAALSGSFAVDGAPLEFKPGGFQPTAVSDRLRGLFTNASGTLLGTARLRLVSGDLSGTGRVQARGFGFQTVALGRVSGVNGVVEFDDLLALTTPPGQFIEIDEIDPGLAFNDGRLQFQLKGPGEARLESAVWPFAGGRLVVEPTVWTLGAERRDITVRADAIELSQVLSAFAAKDLDVRGTVSGRFPLVLEGGSAIVDDARFAADEKGGVVQYTGSAAGQASAANESVALAFDALRDFRYTVLELGANGDLAGEMILTIRMTGRNPEVLSGAPFAFNVSLDSELARLIQSGRDLSNSDWIADAVKEQLAQENNEKRKDERP